ncbi:MAG: cell division protein FtsL [Cellvibrionaceae bacterium]|nr:cell division protein FtsL [Cellvibrionaceae bacterium]
MTTIIRAGLRSLTRWTLLVLVLWLTLLSSAVAVVYVTYDTRVKFNHLESLRRDYNRLQVVWGQYLLERSTWASYGRIEKLAAEKLSMRIPAANQIIIVADDEN